MANQRRSLLAVSLFPLLMFTACNNGGISGVEKENLPPTTGLTVDAVDLPDGALLSSRIPLSWWGNDPDGYIIGYEYAIQDTSENAWIFTNVTDSIFVLPVEAGKVADTVLFKIRAVDNDQMRDPIGASLLLPVQNSQPQIQLNSAQLPPSETFGVFSVGWTVYDQDGLVSVESVEMAFNDSTDEAAWASIPLPDPNGDGSMFVTVILDKPSVGALPGTPVTASARIGTSLSTPQTPVVFSNLLPGEENTLYIRAVDNSGAVSTLDSHIWYLRDQRSRVLFVNDDGSTQSSTKQAFHLNLLRQNGIIPDVLNISDGIAEGGDKVRLSEAFPSNSATQNRMFSQWDHLYWMSNSLDRNITYAPAMLTEFLSNGGTAFITIPTKELSVADPVLQFLPVSELSKPEGIQNSFRILRNAELTSSRAENPTLKVSQTILNVFPMKAAAGATPLYQANHHVQWITGQVLPYDGNKDLIILSGEGNLVYAGLDLTLANANQNLGSFIEKICIQVLEFTP